MLQLLKNPNRSVVQRASEREFLTTAVQLPDHSKFDFIIADQSFRERCKDRSGGSEAN